MKLATAILPIMVLAAPVAAQSAPKGSELTLYASTNLKGAKRVIAATSANLGGVDADNFAWSLSTKGRWELCMDAGHRAGCRIVTGDIRDLGTDGGAITSVRYLGSVGAAPAPVSTSGATSAAPEAQGPSYVGYVYDTDFNDMTITSWTPTSVTGRYEYAAGRLEGTPSGNTVSGYWMQEESPLTCGTARGGTTHWGRFTFTFSADRGSFTGKWGDCGDAPSKPWNGRLIRKTGSAATGATSGSAQPTTPGVVRRVGQRAGDAAERRAGDEVERRVGNAVGKLLGGD